MRRYEPVERPERTVTVKTKSATYVYLTNGVEYKKSKKRSEPKRTLIGKLNEDGMLIPNQNYIDIYGQKVHLEIQQKRSDCISFGLKLLTDKITEKNQMKVLLQNIFDKDADKILDTACYMISSENNVMQYIDDYGYNHALFNKKVFDDSSVGRIFDNIQGRDIDLFIKAWVKIHSSKNIYIAYDSTNMNTVAGNLELSEYGHAKDDDSLPQINLSLGYNLNDNTPLFYELYPGSIIDNYECKKMVERAKSYGCEQVGFILDRGYFSLNNIRYFNENNYNYLLMTKGNAKFIQAILNEYGSNLKNGYSNYIEEHEIYGLTLKKDLFNNNKPVYVHLFYNGIEAEKEKILINKRFYKCDQNLNMLVSQKIKREEDFTYYSKFYDLSYDDNGYFLAYRRNDKKIRQLIDTAGFFCLISSEDLSATEALDRYRNRDAVEKIFRMDKSYLGNDVFRVHNDTRLESKMFISFIALIIRNELCNVSRKLIKENKNSKNEFTVPRIIRQLERLNVTKYSDGNYRLRYALTKYFKTLLKEFDVDEAEYENYAKSVINELDLE